MQEQKDEADIEAGAGRGPLLARPTAYFSMEVGLEEAIPTYSGGLGMLAGDTLRSAADLGLPVVAMTLLYRKGYFEQRLRRSGAQTNRPVRWRPQDHLEKLDARTTVTISGREVRVDVWRYVISGHYGHDVPVYLLDSDIRGNHKDDRALTQFLYGGDAAYRLSQEALLGLGGVDMLRELGHDEIECFHMNEGHSALLTVRLLEQRLAAIHGEKEKYPRAAVRREADELSATCAFTTHTPVPAGHDAFPKALAEKILGAPRTATIFAAGIASNKTLNMTQLALRHSGYVNGVALKHAQISRKMFPRHEIRAVTNGIHHTTWCAPPMAALFDEAIPEWRGDPAQLRHAVELDLDQLAAARAGSKKLLLDEIATTTAAKFDAEALTLGFARRATAYKRADLLFSDAERLEQLANRFGPLQIVYAGKAHPKDVDGQALIAKVHAAAKKLRKFVRFVYLPNYGMRLGALITGGVDVWLNNPEKPLEASGTSGMKCSLNGIPNLSVLDGWWIEGHFEGVTGWSIDGATRKEEADSLYDKLESDVAPLYYESPREFLRVRRSAVAINGAHFTTHRMIAQYVQHAYSGVETERDSE